MCACVQRALGKKRVRFIVVFRGEVWIGLGSRLVDGGCKRRTGTELEACFCGLSRGFL